MFNRILKSRFYNFKCRFFKIFLGLYVKSLNVFLRQSKIEFCREIVFLISCYEVRYILVQNLAWIADIFHQ